MMHRLFAYGTLRDAALMDRVAGRHVVRKRDVLDGYRHVTHPDGYSLLKKDSFSHVNGYVVELSDEEINKVDAWEKQAYDRKPLPKKLKSGTAAEAYIFKPSSGK
jgi:gamma-glutamylcyclotransferase (GGCT)/AIG2-like uncharacterized protein YtfP